MSDQSQNERLAEILEDFHHRRALGERVTAEDYREAAGEYFDELREILNAEASIDAAMKTGEVTIYPIPFGDYTLLSELGRGAMGVVYMAVHRSLGRKVALKVLRTGFDTHPTAVGRFQREARACAQVRHDNIVRIYEAGQHDGRHYYTMEMLPGKSLSELADGGALPEPMELAGRLAEVVDALAVLHEQGIVHRDVKPSNIMVEPSGRMILADFGLARTVASESLTQTGDNVGTPLYMSPEQLLGRQDEIDARSDIYAMGATLYELLAGHPVFQTTNLRVLMRMILNERPDPIADAPEPLLRIALKALEKKNADRYADAASMAADLRAFAHGQHVEGRPLNRAERGVRVLQENRRWVVGGMLAAAAVMAAIVLQPPAPAQLTVRSAPVAELLVADAVQGDTELTVELAMGRHEIVLRREGWRERRFPVDLAAAEIRTIDTMLVPEDPTDPEALAQLAAALDMKMEPWSGVEAERSDADAISILFPRGAVRVEDVDAFRFQIGEAFEQPGAIVIRKGKEELFRRAVDDDWPEELETRFAVPDAVTAELRKGAKLTWGFEPDDGKAVMAKIQVVAPNLSRRLDRIDKQFGAGDEVVARQLRAQLFLSKDLAYAAYREAKGALELDESAVQALQVMRKALKKMDLAKSPVWSELVSEGTTADEARRVRKSSRTR